MVIRFFLSILLFLFCTTAGHANTSDFEKYPDHFQIRQDRALRLFHIQSDKQFLGTVVSSSTGILEFYNNKKEKEWINKWDALYDSKDVCVGNLDFEIYKYSFLQLLFYDSNKIAICSDTGSDLVTLDSEISNIGYVRFFFRDAETQEILAIGHLETERLADNGKKGKYFLQDWYVSIQNRQRLQEINVLPTFLIWALLKHSQRLFPSHRRCPFEEDYEGDVNELNTPEADETIKGASSLSEFPEQFYIQQHPALRLFRIVSDDSLLGLAASTQKESFNFYDTQKQKCFVNRIKCLYAPTGRCIGHIRHKADKEFIPRSTFAEIRADDDTLLVVMDAEDAKGDRFIFRDAETLEPLAVANWNFEFPKNYYLSWISNTQNWSVTILNRKRLLEKEISMVHLSWALLKTSEKHFPFSWYCPFVDMPLADELWD